MSSLIIAFSVSYRFELIYWSQCEPANPSFQPRPYVNRQDYTSAAPPLFTPVHFEVCCLWPAPTNYCRR